MAKQATKRPDDYFRPPHGGRPPSEEAVKKATAKYVADAALAAKRKK